VKIIGVLRDNDESVLDRMAQMDVVVFPGEPDIRWRTTLCPAWVSSLASRSELAQSSRYRLRATAHPLYFPEIPLVRRVQFDHFWVRIEIGESLANRLDR
jgi:hypothetical protein